MKDLVGRRIRCIYMHDYVESLGLRDKHISKLRNIEGTVVSIDSAGRIIVNWDNKTTTPLNPRIDIFEVIENS